MKVVIADTSPINYLLLINHIELLAALFRKAILPSVVKEELSHPKAPLVVRSWIASPPAWVEVRQIEQYRQDPELASLDPGERDVIVLATELQADLLLIDDQEGTLAARAKGFEVTGTLGILQRAAQKQLLNIEIAVSRLQQTNFRCRRETLINLIG